MSEHHYQTKLHWTGNKGKGTAHYTAYTRNHEISAPGKFAPIPGSSDPHFRGDPPATIPKSSCWPPSPPATCFLIFINAP